MILKLQHIERLYDTHIKNNNYNFSEQDIALFTELINSDYHNMHDSILSMKVKCLINYYIIDADIIRYCFDTYSDPIRALTLYANSINYIQVIKNDNKITGFDYANKFIMTIPIFIAIALFLTGMAFIFISICFVIYHFLKIINGTITIGSSFLFLPFSGILLFLVFEKIITSIKYVKFLKELKLKLKQNN